MFSINYSARHKECGELTILSDHRFKSRDDLKPFPNVTPVKMHCRMCYLELVPTHFEIWESVRLGVAKIVGETPIDRLDEECRKLTII